MDLEKQFGKSVAPFQLPIRENEKFVGFVNVVKMAGRRFTKMNEYEACPIPDYVEKHLTIARSALLEAVAESSDELMEKYFAGEEFTVEEIQAALRENVERLQDCSGAYGFRPQCSGILMYLLQVLEKILPLS